MKYGRKIKKGPLHGNHSIHRMTYVLISVIPNHNEIMVHQRKTFGKQQRFQSSEYPHSDIATAWKSEHEVLQIHVGLLVFFSFP